MKKILFLLCALVCCTSLYAQKSDWAQYSRYEAANREIAFEPVAVFMGNSITDIWYQQHPAFFDENHYLGRGIGGQVTSQMLCRFRNDVIELKPQCVVILAGINDIPYTLYEASAIDGASKTQQFFHITLPNLMTTITFTLLTSLISAFQVFDVVYVTTGGGPLFSTETMVQYIYYRGFSMPYELGYASAMAVELFLVIAVLVLLFKGVLERKMKKIY